MAQKSGSFTKERKFYMYFVFVWFIIPAQLKRELIIFIFNQRRVGRPVKYNFTHKQVLAAMGQVNEGSPPESYTPENGYWAKVAQILGYYGQNKNCKKVLYMKYLEDGNGLKTELLRRPD
jgi:hypothetical protein